MSCDPFIIHVSNDKKQATLDRVAKAIQANGGTFNGDVTSGSFSGSGVEGTYKEVFLNAPTTQYQITITKKPWLASCSLVESKIREYFK